MSGNRGSLDERIARARTLAATRPAAAEALTFYAALAEYQKSLVSGRSQPHFLSLVEALDLDSILDVIPEFLAWLPRVAPAQLAESAARMRQLGREEWRPFVASYLAGDNRERTAHDHAVVFVIEALLQPFAERAAMAAAAPPQDRSSARCPFCADLPVVGALREEGQGAKRTLVCALCLTEREYLRVVCPACGEQTFDVLPIFTAEQFPHVRIEACDRCRRYLKTIDLTKDGLAVPLVDDIASPSLDLWARDRGYERLRANVLGM